MTPLLAVASIWYAFPLIVSVTLVCAATRHERPPAILNHAVRLALWIVFFMALFAGLVALLEKLA